MLLLAKLIKTSASWNSEILQSVRFLPLREGLLITVPGLVNEPKIKALEEQDM
jgi:hypothetical protein